VKMYGGRDVQFHAFSTSALDGGEWSASRPEEGEYISDKIMQVLLHLQVKGRLHWVDFKQKLNSLNYFWYRLLHVKFNPDPVRSLGHETHGRKEGQK
jgi:hypothetical protein